jgi:hypothetical protein
MASDDVDCLERREILSLQFTTHRDWPFSYPDKPDVLICFNPPAPFPFKVVACASNPQIEESRTMQANPIATKLILLLFIALKPPLKI